MEVEFYSDDPRQKSRRRLDEILSNGADQIAIACAFCTGAGIEVLLRHVDRLKNPESFAIVSSDFPTDYAKLERLHNEIPNNLFVHWGSLSPYEKKVGAALMHSKVFYARAGDECWLWTGSHNLTGSATQGGNCEAAVILHGDSSEKPFVDAMQHLQACRDEAKLYDPSTPPEDTSQRVDLIAIHAESNSIPSIPFPWHFHLCLESADFDKLLGPPANVRLILYPIGSLHSGWQSATPSAAFFGSLTGQNLTAANPRAGLAGIPAQWNAANFGITETSQVLRMGQAGPPQPSITTQVIFHINGRAEHDEPLFSEKPRAELRRIPGEARPSDVDSDVRHYFTSQSLVGSKLLNVPYVGRRVVISLPGADTRKSDLETIRTRLGTREDAEIEFRPTLMSVNEKRHPFIVRVKYRLGER